MKFLIEHIWWILGGGGLLLLVGAYLFFSTNLFQKVRDKLSPNSDKYIDAKIFCEDKKIRNRRQKIGRYCVQDDTRRMGWHLVHDLLVTGQTTGKQFLVLSERDDFPIDFHGRLNPEIINQYPTSQNVFLDSTADIRSQAARQAAKTFMSGALSLIAILGALVFVVMAIILFWGNRGGG